ncbi:MAG: FAD-dependent oxidoreductase [Micromonosporaceae bacterium]|nr:FAD-dependent oxidoreductase [Micromonosporaceae bacterium]
MASSADLVVLGAGPAGLAAAWRAAKAGRSVVVLDRAPVVGGMAGSFAVAGAQVDHGSHRLHPNTPPAIMRDISDLLGDDLQRRPRNGRLRVAGRWVGFPLRPAELARRLPLGLTARVGLDALAAPLRRQRHDSYAGVLRASLGPGLYEALYAPYAKKLWGLDGARLDAEQARRRVSADTPWKIAARMLRRRGTGQGRVFYYPRRGFGQIVEALADAAVAAGAKLCLGAEAGRIVPGDDAVTVSVRDGDEFTAGHLFTTVPLPALARLCRPGPPPGVLEAAGRLRFRAMVLVYLAHAGRPWTAYDAHYLPDPDTPVTRISEPANYRDSADDPADRTVLCAEIPCDRDDAVWQASDEALADLVADALARHGLPPVRLSEVEVRRIPFVYPVYETGYAEHLRGLDEWAGTLPRTTTFGRLGLFVHDNTHHAIAMAYDAVDALGDGSWRPEKWARARQRFTEHVVED